MGQPATESHSHETRPVPVIALIGGVGSGKSALARWVSQHLNTVIIDGDVAGHQALRRPDVKKLIRSRFGSEVFDTAHEICRDRLADAVFGEDEEHQQARHDLEQIVHPVIRGDLQDQIAAARHHGAVDVILLDAAVLLEAGWQEICTAVVYVETPIEQRWSRVAERGWTPADLGRREASQLSLNEKRAAAQFVIENSGSLDDAGRQFLKIIEQITTSPEK